MNGTRKIASNTIFLYIRLVIVLIISLFTVRVVLQSLGDVNYGIYNVVGGFVSMFGFFNTAMSNGVQRFYNFELGKNGVNGLKQVYSSSLYIQLFLAFSLVVIVEFIGVWYINNRMVIPVDKIVAANWIFQCAVVSLLITFIQIPYLAAIIAYEKMNFYAFVGIVDAVLKLLIAYAISNSTNNLIVYGVLLLSVNLLNFILFISYAKLKFKNLCFVKAHNWPMIKQMLSFTGWNTFGAFAYMIRWQGVNVLMNAFFGVIINAANGIASQVSSAFSYFSNNLFMAFKPQVVQSYASNNYERTQYLFFLMSRMAYALVLTLAVPVIIEVDYILTLWLGTDIPNYTSSFAVLVIISVILGTLHTPIVQVIHATGYIRKFQIVTSIIITAILPISWVGLYIGLNPNWVYWVTIFMFIVNQIAGMIMLKRQFEYSYGTYIKEVILPLLLFTVIVPIAPYFITYILSPSFLRLVIICMITVIIATSMALVIILSRSERNQVLKRIKKVLS